MTEAGLNTINLSQLNTFQQFILFLLILLGSAIWVSIAVVHVRKKAFERRFKSIDEEHRQRRRNRSFSRRRLSLPNSHLRPMPEVDGVVVRGRAITSEKDLAQEVDGKSTHSCDQPQPNGNTSAINRCFPESDAEEFKADNSDFDSNQAGQPSSIDTPLTRRITFRSPASPTRDRRPGRMLSMEGAGARQNVENHPSGSSKPTDFNGLSRLDEGNAGDLPLPPHRILSQASIGRNSQFSNLSLAEREAIGGVEYRAITYLAFIVPVYFVLWQLLGCIGLGAYVASKRASTTDINAENPWYA